MTRRKRILVAVVTRPLVWLFRLLTPLAPAWTRFMGLARLQTALQTTVPASTQLDGQVHVLGTGMVQLGEACRLGRHVLFETQEAGRIRLGSHVRINTGSVLVAYSLISIGDDTLVGEYVSIRDANHGSAPDVPIRLQAHSTAPVRIGRDVWIGRGVAVLKGVTIGDGAIVAANSVVIHDVRPGIVVAGAPAHVIQERS